MGRESLMETIAHRAYFLTLLSILIFWVSFCVTDSNNYYFVFAGIEFIDNYIGESIAYFSFSIAFFLAPVP